MGLLFVFMQNLVRTLAYFLPFEKGPHISTFGRKSNKTDPTNFRFISASALRGFSKFGRATGTRTIR
jgi:hypothetical protein